MDEDFKAEAEQLYQRLLDLCNKETKSPSTDIQFELLKKLKFLSQGDSSIIDFLMKRQSIFQINNSGSDKKYITKDEFIDLFAGLTLEHVLFEDKIDEQRFYVEDLTKLFLYLSGNKNLKNSIKKYYKNKLPNVNLDTECNEILELLSSDGEQISIEDFVNIMTCLTPKK